MYISLKICVYNKRKNNGLTGNNWNVMRKYVQSEEMKYIKKIDVQITRWPNLE